MLQKCLPFPPSFLRLQKSLIPTTRDIQDEWSRLPAPVPKALHMLPTFFNSSQKLSKAYVLIRTYFTNEEIEVRRGEVTRSGLHSEWQSQWNQAQTVSLQRPQSQLHSLLEIWIHLEWIWCACKLVIPNTLSQIIGYFNPILWSQHFLNCQYCHITKTHIFNFCTVCTFEPYTILTSLNWLL